MKSAREDALFSTGALLARTSVGGPESADKLDVSLPSELKRAPALLPGLGLPTARAQNLAQEEMSFRTVVLGDRTLPVDEGVGRLLQPEVRPAEREADAG